MGTTRDKHRKITQDFKVLLFIRALRNPDKHFLSYLYQHSNAKISNTISPQWFHQGEIRKVSRNRSPVIIFDGFAKTFFKLNMSMNTIAGSYRICMCVYIQMVQLIVHCNIFSKYRRSIDVPISVYFQPKQFLAFVSMSLPKVL